MDQTSDCIFCYVWHAVAMQDKEESLTGLEAIELHRLESQWVHDLAAEHEFGGGKMVVIVHLPGTDRPAEQAALDERMFHLFLVPGATSDVLVRDNANGRSDEDLRAIVQKLLPE
jgi:hypothetical protein